MSTRFFAANISGRSKATFRPSIRRFRLHAGRSTVALRMTKKHVTCRPMTLPRMGKSLCTQGQGKSGSSSLRPKFGRIPSLKSLIRRKRAQEVFEASLRCPIIAGRSYFHLLSCSFREKRSRALQRCNLTRDIPVDGAPRVLPVPGRRPSVGDSLLRDHWTPEPL
ncbi:hypothetical protein Poly41_25590 [Novipirellula artificiosorum]|uniref:Uncharacterized protein n=1 Tax=Novipirellula artificiosorum TaxID=2528016 RepID=A0A5C6DR01_9BACT|nr:hypothetical protein Poly41_25590 [Novipirellula artificiosorum]